MKSKISPPVMIGAICAAVLLIGLIAWKMFIPASESGSADIVKAAHIRKEARENSGK